MKAYIGITDGDWYRSLAARPDLDEVNFWQPGGSRHFRALQTNELFLFKLHAPHHFIVGGGLFGHFSILPCSLAWEAFGTSNGARDLTEMRARVGRYRRAAIDPREDYQVGCILLEQPFFFEERDWIAAPRDWGRQTVQGATCDLSQGEGRRIWEELVLRAPGAVVGRPAAGEPLPLVAAEPRFGQPTTVLPRLGQGTFRVLVTDIYDRRCAVTGERTLPVLQAAHIRPYSRDGPHDPRNGLLLRSDLHTLFDRGYVTVSPDRRFEVSRRIREEFENGREYYRLHGQPVREPGRPDWRPSPEFLDWHASNIFRG